jgi:hypothetical protein
MQQLKYRDTGGAIEYKISIQQLPQIVFAKKCLLIRNFLIYEDTNQGPYMKGSGRIKKEMVLGFRNGQMGLVMRDNGWKIRHVDMGSISVQMEMYLKASGEMIRQMVMVFISIGMVQCVRVSGRMICSTEREFKLV